MKTVVSVCSARPNFVKLAAVHHALAARPLEFTHVIVHTGQHYDPLLSDVFFEQLSIPQPSFNLGVHGGTREEVIENTKSAFAKVLPEIDPDIVLVYGDVNGAVGAALATKEGGYKLGHVEAGLRSFDESMPEEHNRISVDEMADLLFCSEDSGMKHLEEEGVRGKKFLVGNVMIDTLVRMMPHFESNKADFKSRLSIMDNHVIVTIHRPSNVDDPQTLTKVMSFIGDVAAIHPIFIPAHPRLSQALDNNKITIPYKVAFTSPLPYLDFLYLLQKSTFILTDSGGIQEEATFLKKRCFTLRLNTERPSTIKSGSNVLIDINNEEDRQQVLAFAKNPNALTVNVPAIWDGKAGERIAEILVGDF